MANIYTSADQLIGKTPLLELSGIEKKFGLKAKLLAKLEYFNPAGSVKDRIAKAMIDDAEKSGKLGEGGPAPSSSARISKVRRWPPRIRVALSSGWLRSYARGA